jgi:hypothetical protein
MGKGKGALGQIANVATYGGYGGLIDFTGMDNKSSAGPRLDMSRYDTREQAKKYEDLMAVERQKNIERNDFAAGANQNLIKDLQAQAAGQGPSLADAQLKAASNRNLSQMMAAASASRGGNAGLQQRQVRQQGAQAGREVAETSAINRMQEQQQARNMLANQLNSQQQMAGANVRDYTTGGLQAATDPYKLLSQFEETRFAQDVARRNGVKEQQSAIQGGGMQAASTIGSMFAGSDERGKENIKPADKKVQAFLDALSAKSYNYKDTNKPGTAEGTRTGIMAQDLERSDMGKELVTDTPSGKMVNTQQGFGAVLAAQSELNKRLKALEGKKK